MVKCDIEVSEVELFEAPQTWLDRVEGLIEETHTRGFADHLRERPRDVTLVLSRRLGDLTVCAFKRIGVIQCGPEPS